MNKNIIFLLSHTPNPRIMKRARFLKAENKQIGLIYARRTQNINFIFDELVFDSRYEIKYDNKNLFRRLNSLIIFAHKTLKYLKKEKPYIIHLTNLDMLLCAVLYKKISDRSVKLIYEIADIPDAIIQDRNTFKSRLIQKVESKLCKNIESLILTAEDYWNVYYSLFVDEKKYHFIPNKPEKQYFKDFENKKFENDKIIVGYVGYVRYKKELKVLMDIVNSQDKLHFIVAGDGLEVAELKTYAVGKKRIQFLGPYSYSQDIANLYQQIDIVYSAYDNENINCQLAIPNRLYEAIVCQKPIIVSKGTCLSHYVEANGIGVAINPMNKMSVLEGLEEIIINYQSYQQNIKQLNEKKWFDDYKDLIAELYV